MRRLVGIEPEIIQCAPANRIGVLVLRKGFRRPANGIGRLSNRPWHTSVTLVVKGAVVCPARFLRWRMKVDIADVDSRSYRYTERLNSPIKVLIIQGILIVPDALAWIGHFV